MPQRKRQQRNDDADPVAAAAPPVMLTQEQFQLLISQISQHPESDRNSRSPTPSSVLMSGNFVKCTSRFDGSPDADVDAFLDSVTTYKECANVTNENALRGLPILLEGIAATWWKGVKSTIPDWNSAVKALRDAYSRKLPPPLIFKEIFVRDQRHNESTELFVCHIRSLFAQLPYEMQESIQIDMLYGLLNRAIRSRVTRSEINSYQTLLNRARDIELSLREGATVSARRDEQKSGLSEPLERKPRPKCAFCKCFGHTDLECRKALKKGRNGKQTIVQAAVQSQTVSSVQADTPATASSPKFKCFKCQTPGYITSNCPKCNVNHSEAIEFSATYVEGLPRSRPIARISIDGHHGLACLDSGAKGNLAGTQLCKLLISKKLPFQEDSVLMRFADGREDIVKVKVFQVNILIESRIIPTRLLAIPEHTSSNMLLGIEFLKAAQIVVDIPHDQWYFADRPDNPYPFVQETVKNPMPMSTVNLSEISLSSEEGKHLPPDKIDQINSLLREYADVFDESSEPTPYAEHSIKLTDETPVAVPPYRLSEPKKRFLEQQLEKMIELDIIEECESAYAAPVVLVPKGNNKEEYRVCVDYRGINALTVPDRYPLPRLDDLLHEAKKTSYMTTLDLRSGYWQVPVKTEDRDKTGFITPFGSFRYKRMPFGLRNAPSTFQRLVDRFKSGLPGIFILAYLDDVVVLSATFEQHLADLKRVFDRLRLFKLQVNRSKCTFATPEIKYLGHVITANGIKPSPGKIAAILDIPKPKNLRQLLTFIQTVSWFRKFIPNCAELMKPLTELTKKNAIWKWEKRQDDSFTHLKQLLTSAPILRQADPNQPFILRTDASSYALGAALMQGEPPNDQPIEYASRLLTDAERNYTTTEREALAVVWAVEKFQGYIDSAPVKIISDHQPLRWLMSIKSPSGRLARWALKLQGFDLKIDYTPGKCNALADTLSRLPYAEKNPVDACQVSLDLPATNYDEIRTRQLEDPDVSKIIRELENTNEPVHTKRWTERGYLLLNGALYRFPPDGDEEEAAEVIPKSKIQHVLHEYHDAPLAGHYGAEKTYRKIRSRFYWPGMRRTITHYVKDCLECQRFKPSNLKPAGLLQTPIQNRRFEVLAIDLFGPLPKTSDGHQWILVIEDTTTRWVELFPLARATAETCARCLIDEVILRYGTPRRVISDNGPQFVSEILQIVAYALGFKQNLVPAYHPEANPVERKNRDIKTQLAILTSQKHDQWSIHLPSIRFAMNSTTSSATGQTPAFLTFGRELKTPDDVERDLRPIIQNAPFVSQITPYLLTISETMLEAREHCESQQDSTKRNADRHRRPAPAHSLGDKVLVDVHALSKSSQSYTSKFAPRRDGPYLISAIKSPTTYQIVSPSDPNTPLGVYHSSALTPYRDSEYAADPEPVRPLRKRGRPKKQP